MTWLNFFLVVDFDLGHLCLIYFKGHAAKNAVSGIQSLAAQRESLFALFIFAAAVTHLLSVFVCVCAQHDERPPRWSPRKQNKDKTS